MNKLKLLFLLTLLSVTFTSCKTVPPRPVAHPPRPVPRSSVTHTVAPGETLWRISKIYDVPMSSILLVNSIKDDSTLAMGQQLRIPSARKPEQLITMPPSDKWQYIIIHHTATDHGSSLDFHKSHLSKGWDRGIGYHFVINNGSGEKADGFIEVTPRWLKQQDGAHCKASDMNIKGIGISLVGNFNEHSHTQAQMASLVHLVKLLRTYYKIPVKNIQAHGQVEGSHTECPGANFPWQEFKSKI